MGEVELVSLYNIFTLKCRRTIERPIISESRPSSSMPRSNCNGLACS